VNQQLLTQPFDLSQTCDVALEAAETYVRAAQRRLSRDRAAGLAALDDIFRCGRAAQPNGRHRGELVALDVAPGLTGLLGALANRRLPWQGKVFDAANNYGDNVFSRDSYAPARVLWPFHRRYRDDGPATYRAFDFRTSVGPSRQDANLDVLRLDYNLPANPRLFVTVRRVLDELVQVADGYYLGKAYVHWYWGTWSMVAYFALRPEQGAVVSGSVGQ
jgi:hypothetical protein